MMPARDRIKEQKSYYGECLVKTKRTERQRLVGPVMRRIANALHE